MSRYLSELFPCTLCRIIESYSPPGLTGKIVSHIGCKCNGERMMCKFVRHVTGTTQFLYSLENEIGLHDETELVRWKKTIKNVWAASCSVVGEGEEATVVLVFGSLSLECLNLSDGQKVLEVNDDDSESSSSWHYFPTHGLRKPRLMRQKDCREFQVVHARTGQVLKSFCFAKAFEYVWVKPVLFRDTVTNDVLSIDANGLRRLGVLKLSRLLGGRVLYKILDASSYFLVFKTKSKGHTIRFVYWKQSGEEEEEEEEEEGQEKPVQMRHPCEPDDTLAALAVSSEGFVVVSMTTMHFSHNSRLYFVVFDPKRGFSRTLDVGSGTSVRDGPMCILGTTLYCFDSAAVADDKHEGNIVIGLDIVFGIDCFTGEKTFEYKHDAVPRLDSIEAVPRQNMLLLKFRDCHRWLLL